MCGLTWAVLAESTRNRYIQIAQLYIEIVHFKYSDSCLSCHYCCSFITILNVGGFQKLNFVYSQVDQMVIHSASDPRPRTTICGDYFYNYFTCGIDILFDGQYPISDYFIPQLSNVRVFYLIFTLCIIFLYADTQN